MGADQPDKIRPFERETLSDQTAGKPILVIYPNQLYEPENKHTISLMSSESKSLKKNL